MRKIFLSLLIILFLPVVSQSQTLYRKMGFGFFGDFEFNSHISQFSKLPDIPCCAKNFQNGTGIGFAAGILADYPINRFLFFDLRAGYFLRSGNLISRETKILSDINGNPIDGVFENTLKAKLGSIAVEPMLAFRIVGGFSVHFGLHGGFVVPKSYEQWEEIKEPSGGTYENDKRIRLAFSGSIPKALSYEISAVAGASYELPLNKRRTVWLAPEVFLNYGFTPVISGYTWNILMIRAGIAIKFSQPFKSSVEINPPEQNLKIYEYTLCDNSVKYISKPDSLQFKVKAESETGFESWNYAIKYRNVFLDEKHASSAKIPDSVLWKIPPVINQRLYQINDTLDFVFDVFDAVGQSATDKSKIIINPEKVKLSSALTLHQQNIPEVLDRIKIEDYNNKSGNMFSVMPEYVTFKPLATSLDELKNWKIVLQKENQKIFDTTGTGNPPPKIDFNIKNTLKQLPLNFNGDLTYYMEVTDNYGNRCVSERKNVNIARKTFKLGTALHAFGKFQKDSVFAFQENPTVKIEERVSTRLQPILNYVFFDEDSSNLPDRYYILNKDNISSFNLQSLHDSPILNTYHHVLNIIGKRMLDNPSANITITGCNANYRDEKGNTVLSNDRAASVFNYLHNVWGIPENRMEIQARNLPQVASSDNRKPDEEQEIIDAREENRRVEIRSDNDKILEPILTTGTRYIISPQTLLLLPTAQSDAKINEWTLNTDSKDDVLENISGKGHKFPDSTYLNLENNKMTIFNSKSESINIAFNVKNEKNQTSLSSLSLPVERLTINDRRMLGQDTTYDEYSLILFDFASDAIKGTNKSIVELIKDRVNPGAIVEIVGYTDRMGNASINQRLSNKRAGSAKDDLNLKKQNVSSNGVGESELLYDNNLPEGRFYCRTVIIRVKNPVLK
jgi:outer membrane protein OmpA-like peptidoglycan-associated protein